MGNPKLVGGFNPSEKFLSKWESSPSRGENIKYLKPTPTKTYKEVLYTDVFPTKVLGSGFWP